MKKIMIWLIVLCAIIVSGCSSSTSSKGVKTGEEGILYIKGGGMDIEGTQIIMLATDEAYFDEMITTIRSGNGQLIGELVESGKAFYVNAGTKVLVIKMDWSKEMVKISEGENLGRTGWVPYEWIWPISNG